MAEPPPGLASSLTAPDAALAGATGVPDGNCRGPEALAEADLAGLVSPGPLDVADAVADAAGAAARLAAALAAAAAALGARVDPGSQSPERGQTLAPEPPPCRPDASAQGAPPRVPLRLPLGIYDDSVEAAEFLVRRPNVVLLVDGYNATLSASQWASLGIAEQRRRLTDALAELAARTGAEIEVVFDGAEATMGPGAGPARRPVRVVFSPPGVEADDIVIERAAQLPTTRPVVVASSDRRVQEGARHYGANVIGSDQLMALLRARR